MSAIQDLIVSFSNWVWGLPMLVVLLGGGIILTLYVGGVQFTKFSYVLKHTIGSLTNQESKDGKVTGYQALTAALSATIGTGNIIGVGMAIAMGGPGAVFWMWIIGFVAMGIKYSEVLASVKYREPLGNGEYKAGPYMYIKKGVKSNFLAMFWSISMLIGLFIAAGVHTGAIVDTLDTISVPKVISTVGAMLVVAVILFGGVQRLVKFTEKMVPIMSVLYIGGVILIMLINAGNILPSFKLIFQYAFKPVAPIGAFVGSALANTVRWGVSRGMYSSDAGNGVPSIMHGQADVDHPVEQAIWGVFEVFFDTIIVCTFSALAVLTSESWLVYDQSVGATLVARSFGDTLGAVGSIGIVIITTLFAISTVVSIAYFLKSQVTTLLGEKAGDLSQYLYIIFMFMGGMFGVQKLMFLADAGNAFTILVNMLSLVLLRNVLRDETKDYFSKVES